MNSRIRILLLPFWLVLVGLAHGQDLYLVSAGVNTQKDGPDFGVDAQQVAKAFNASKSLYKNVQKKVLVNDQADRTGVLAGLKWMHDGLKANDVGFFYLSSHGGLDPDHGYLAWVYRSKGPRWTEKVLWSEDIAKALEGSKGKVVVMLDTCHSGAAPKTIRNPNVAFICACRHDETAYNGPRRGYLSRGICEGLQGKADFNHDGVVTLHELMNYAVSRANALSEMQQHGLSRLFADRVDIPVGKPAARTVAIKWPQ